MRAISYRRWSVRNLAYLFALVILFALGIRGRLSLAPMDWGVAYFSDNRFLNQLALNGIYTLGRNLNESEHDPRLTYLTEKDRFPFADFSEALKTVQNMLSQGNEQWLKPDKSLDRITYQDTASFGFKPNLIIVVMESWAAENTGVLGSTRGLTPNFDGFASEGILFRHFYASGTRTNYGLAATLCSFPAVPGRSVLKRYNAKQPFTAISELLRGRGYFNAFAYGGDIAFDNMEGFFRQEQYDRFYGEDHFPKTDYFSKWGVPDKDLFEQLVRLTDSFPRPFQLSVMTLSNHEPFDLPDSSVQRYRDDSDTSRVFNAQIYADFALGSFIEGMKNRPVFDSTIFVFVSDHTLVGNSPLGVDPRFFHIPMLIYSPALLGTDGNIIDTYASQVDLLPTVMGILGSDFVHSSWGRNVLLVKGDDSGFATMSIATRIGYLDRTCLYFEDLGRTTDCFINDNNVFRSYQGSNLLSDDCLAAQMRLRRYMQLADQMSTPQTR